MTILRNFWQHLRKPAYLYRLLGASAFLALSVWLNFQAGVYAYNHMSNGVSDLLLDHVAVYDVSLLFIEGAAAMVIGALLLCIANPPKLIDATATIALMYLLRAGFISLTHLGPPLALGDIGLGDTLASRFVHGADYFFSGHTALPFLIALLFWEKVWVRNIYLILTVVFGAAAIMGHLHYSIDVFAAPFIAYGVYSMRRYLWNPT